MKAHLNDRAIVRASMSDQGLTVADLPAGAEVDIGRTHHQAGRDWVEATLPDGRKGYLDGTVGCTVPRKARILHESAELREGTAPGAPVQRRLERGEVVTLLAAGEHEGRPWALVRDGSGVEGFIDGDVPVAGLEGDSPLLSFLGGALVVLLLGGGVGAVLLCLRGHFLAALALLAVCALSGGLAGLTHWLTAGWRDSAFGPHAAWALIVASYLVAVPTSAWVVEALAPQLGTTWLSSFTSLSFLFLLGGAAVAGGLLLGYRDLLVRRATGLPVPAAAWLAPLLGGAGLGLLGWGAHSWALYRQDWPVFEHVKEEPQEVRLADLLRDGPGDNHHVRVTDFRFCAEEVVVGERKVGELTVRDLWVPIVPRGAPGGLPSAVQAVVVETDLRREGDRPLLPGGRERRWRAAARARAVKEGYTGVVLNGLRPIPTEALGRLAEVAPETDRGAVLVLAEGVEPVKPEVMEGRLADARKGLLGGAALVLLAVGWAWVAARRGPARR
jgi:hypothetical protein